MLVKSRKQEPDAEGDIVMEAEGEGYVPNRHTPDPEFGDSWDEAMQDSAAEGGKEEDLEGSKHAPKKKKVVAVDEEMEEDVPEKEDQQGPDPKEIFRCALAFDGLLSLAVVGKGKKEDKAILDSIWNIGRKMDRRGRGDEQAWEPALQEAERMGCRDHVESTKKKWEVWRDRLIDRKELAMIRVAGELETLKNQMAVVIVEIEQFYAV